MKNDVLKILLLAAAMSNAATADTPTAADTTAAQSAPVQVAGPGAAAAPMTQRLRERQRQHAPAMQSPGDQMPWYRGAMMPPEMRQRMQAMREQQRQMMQAARRGMPMTDARPGMMGAAPQPTPDAPAQDTQTADSVVSAMPDMPELPPGRGPAAGGWCGHCQQGLAAHRHHRHGQQYGMHADRQAHMQRMEQRLADIEALLRELVELQRSR